MVDWELRVIGQVDRGLLGDSAVLYENGRGSVVLGSWEQDALIELIGALITRGLEVESVQRLEASHEVR